MTGFREALEFCHLGDLGFSGPMYTWCNWRSDGTFTKERLDRAVANLEWCSIFPMFSVLIMVARSSDHNPMLVSFFGCLSEKQAQFPSSRRFKFEASWENDVECNEVINMAWKADPTELQPLEGIQVRLAECQRALSNWNRQKFGNVVEKIKRKSA